MKKLLALLIILSIVNIAGAAVLKVVPVDIELSGGRLGLTLGDALEPSDYIGLAIVLENNPYSYQGTPMPDYDGYYLSSIDIDLEVGGPGTLSVGTDVFGQPQLLVDSGIAPFAWTGIAGNAIAQMTGIANPAIGPGEMDIIWNLILHCDGEGSVVIDLTLNGLSQYALYKAGPPDYPAYEWLDMTEGDLGDLVIYQIPEPMTVALLGLGGLFLLRRRK